MSKFIKLTLAKYRDKFLEDSKGKITHEGVDLDAPLITAGIILINTNQIHMVQVRELEEGYTKSVVVIKVDYSPSYEDRYYENPLQKLANNGEFPILESLEEVMTMLEIKQ